MAKTKFQSTFLTNKLLKYVLALAAFGIVFLTSVKKNATNHVKHTKTTEIRRTEPRNSPASEKLQHRAIDSEFKYIRERLGKSSNPEREMVAIVSDINQLRGFKREYALTLFLSKITDFETADEAFSWVAENSSFLYKTLSTLKVGENRNAYQDILERINDLCSAKGVDFISKVNASSNNQLKVAILPIDLSMSISWNNPILAELEPKTRSKVEEQTIQRLAFERHSNGKALEMLLDPDCSIKSNKLINQVISRAYFWDNPDSAVSLIQQSPAGPNRDDALMRAVNLIAEKDVNLAKQWASIIDDKHKRYSALEKLDVSAE